MFTKVKSLSLIIGILMIGACGGGGGGGHKPTTQNTPTAPTPTPQPTPNTTNPAPSTPIITPQPSTPTIQADADILKQLNLRTYAHGIVDDAQLVLNTDTGEINIQLLPDPSAQTKTTFFGNDPQIHTLRNNMGQLVGYYGYAGLNKLKKDDFGDYSLASQQYLYVQDMDEQQAKRPDISSNQQIDYTGKMLYRYNDTDATLRTADVQASYFGKDKTLSMNIEAYEQGASKLWTLHKEKIAKSSPRVEVDEQGKMSGYLFANETEKKVFSGHFSGGLYGINGEVLTGSVQHEENNTMKMEGVIGATAKP